MGKLFHALLEQKYLRPAVNHKGDKGFKLYEDRQRLIAFYSLHSAEYKSVKDLLRMDSKGRYILNLTMVRQLHGNDVRKRSYKRKKAAVVKRCHPSKFKIERYVQN